MSMSATSASVTLGSRHPRNSVIPPMGRYLPESLVLAASAEGADGRLQLLYLSLLSHLERVIDLNAEITHRAFKFRMPQQ